MGVRAPRVAAGCDGPPAIGPRRRTEAGLLCFCLLDLAVEAEALPVLLEHVRVAVHAGVNLVDLDWPSIALLIQPAGLDRISDLTRGQTLAPMLCEHVSDRVVKRHASQRNRWGWLLRHPKNFPGTRDEILQHPLSSTQIRELVLGVSERCLDRFAVRGECFSKGVGGRLGRRSIKRNLIIEPFRRQYDGAAPRSVSPGHPEALVKGREWAAMGSNGAERAPAEAAGNAQAQ